MSDYKTIAEEGIIPAGAGRSRGHPRLCGWAGDHPRGCGEKWVIQASRLFRKGSSPRVRGEGRGRRARALRKGIIPAGAGRSWRSENQKGEGGDHPRGCGEKLHKGEGVSALKGSSPRVRGEAVDAEQDPAGRGIIPAGAGRSSSFRWSKCLAGDHPRGCGEKAVSPESEESPEGSSPRVRGEEQVADHPNAHAGIIPAGAGRSGASERGS